MDEDAEKLHGMVDRYYLHRRSGVAPLMQKHEVIVLRRIADRLEVLSECDQCGRKVSPLFCSRCARTEFTDGR
jgi:hypothetical protein